MTKLSRRDTLKLIGSFTAGALLQGVQPLFQGSGGIELQKPNIIIFVIDTLSARHLSLYGYERHTTPNLERFASRASVYHNHYAGGNFTTPGTATILTGHYPWSHRAINMGAPVSSHTVADNLFSLVGQGRSNVAFTQNLLVEVLFEQFSQAIQKHIPHVSYYRQLKSPDIMSLFSRDPLTAHYALDDFLIHSKVTSSPVPGSAYFGYLDMLFEQSRRTWSLPSSEYPRGMPATDKYFYDNREVYAGLFEMTQTLEKQSQPYLAYFHLLSPHSPYSAHRDYIDIFPAIKVRAIKRHKLANHVRQAELIQFRTYYDEYIADVDAQFGMLYDNLNDAGILDHSYFIVTSDHGELFERGESGHVTPLLFDSVIHVPLLISAPQQTGRRDFYTRTSNVDLLPTLLALDGGQIPASLEGKILPGFGGPEEENRSIFSLEAKSNSAFGPLKHATVTLMKENHKIIYYGDYPRYSNVFEFYDLEHDPEERNDLFAGGPVAAGLMKEELLDTLSTVNKPYMNPKSS
jgi:arylsulfatase A-like enzyme